MRILLSFAILVSVAAGAFVFFRLRESAPGTKIDTVLAGTRFSLPAAYARDHATKSGGLADRLSFVAAFPGFTPPARAGGPVTAAALVESDRKIISIAVSSKDDSIEPAERPARLYGRFLEGEVWSGPNGLLMRRFEPGSPYESEQLYFAPPDGRAFFARCPKPPAHDAAAAAECLSIFRWKSLDVQLGFEPPLLDRWDVLIEGAREFLARISADAKAR